MTRLGVLALAVFGIAVPAAAESVLLFDFEKGPLSEDWSASGPIGVSRVPAPPFERIIEPAPGGSGVQIAAGPQGFFYSGKVPADWRPFDQLTFWVHLSEADVKQPRTFTLEVRMVERDGKAMFWRKLEIPPSAGWHRLSLPLRWFGPGEGRAPRWDHIARLGFFFRDGANLFLDTIALESLPAGAGRAAWLDDLLAAAFPERRRSDLIVVSMPDLIFATDVTGSEVQRLVPDLTALQAAMARELPFLDLSPTPPCLLIFSDEEAYRAFIPRFARRFNRVASRPTGDSFTMDGVGTGWWDPRQGARRPSFLGVFASSVLERRAHLPDKGEWFVRGIASLYQLRSRPQPNIAQIVLSGVRDEARHRRLQDICNGERVPRGSEWQAMTLVQMLITHPRYRSRLSQLVTAFQSAGSTNLGPHLHTLLQTDWQQLTDDWRRFCLANY